MSGNKYSLFIPALAGVSAMFALVAPAFAQDTGNPIPASGGALIMPAQVLPDPLEAGWQGEKVCEVLQEDARMRALRCTFAPGAGHERHFHSAHFGYVLEGGRMRITDKTGTRDVETKAGDSWKSDGVDWHEALNIGETPTVYIIVEPKASAAN